MEFFKREYPDTGDVAVDVTYVSFGNRLRAIRKEKGMSQDEFAKLLGTSKQILSRYEIGQRIPKITQVQEYAKRLNVSADYLMGDSAEEAALNSLCPKDHPPFYKIFLDVMDQMGLDIPGMVQVSGLTGRQVRTIIIRQMKDAPLPIALQLSDALGCRWRCEPATGVTSPRTSQRRPGRWPGPMIRRARKRKRWCGWPWLCRPRREAVRHERRCLRQILQS